MGRDSLDDIPSKVIFWGGTGQARVLRPIIESYGSEVLALFDDTPGLASPFKDIPLYHGKNGFLRWLKEQEAAPLGFCIAIGNPHGRIRMALHEFLCEHGLLPTIVVHKSAIIEKNAVLGLGTQVMAGAVVGAEAIVGRQCIINTKASVDHECILADGTEVGPGGTLCGLVRTEVNAWICAGATVLPRIFIGENAIVGAGALVTHNIPKDTVHVGVPAREVPRNSSLPSI